MAKAFAEIAASGEADGLGHHEWLGLLLDREASWRQDKRLAARLRVAKLRQQACVEDIDYRNPRGLDRALFQKLIAGEWINAHDNLALIGPTGVGKSWLASALGHKACRDNRSVLYQRVPRAIDQFRGCLAAGFPFVFGFSVYESFESRTVARTGEMPMPRMRESLLGGHAVLAVGYDDDTGRFLARNSWGPRWGLGGYFTMPYDYLLDAGLSDDFWTIRLME